MKTRNKNGFVFMETVVVVCVLSVTLMLLYGSYAHILRVSRERQTFDTTDSIYTTYNVANYIKSLALANYYGFDPSYGVDKLECKPLPLDKGASYNWQSKAFYINDIIQNNTSDNGHDYIPWVCDIGNVASTSPLYPLKDMFDVDKIYINLSPRTILNSPNKNDILMSFDATTIDYIQSLGVGEDFNPNTELYFIVKYKHVYDNGKYDVVHSTLRLSRNGYRDIDFDESEYNLNYYCTYDEYGKTDPICKNNYGYGYGSNSGYAY